MTGLIASQARIGLRTRGLFGKVLSRVIPATLDVLEALLGPDEELYGLKIAQNAGPKAGSVYPILAPA